MFSIRYSSFLFFSLGISIVAATEAVESSFSSSFTVFLTITFIAFLGIFWKYFFAPTNSKGSSLFNLNKSVQSSKKKADEYVEFFNEEDRSKTEDRKSNYATVVNHYYDLATDFYEWGWGECFHFAPRYVGETPKASFARHEHKLALDLSLKKGMKVLDVGCGVGGPMREIARFTKSTIIGINNNAYQVSRGNLQNKAAGLDKLCNIIKGDFMNIPFEDGYFDAIYAIEATCHAPSKVAIYSEICRVLKPGGEFAAYEWCMTEKYNPNNKEHKAIKLGIELGNGIPNLDTIPVVKQALKDAGFEILDVEDVAVPDEIFPVPWYQDFKPSWTLSGFKLTKAGRDLTHFMVAILETLRLIPEGSSKTHTALIKTANSLVEGGEKQLFTPSLYFHVRKPLTNKTLL